MGTGGHNVPFIGDKEDMSVLTDKGFTEKAFMNIRKLTPLECERLQGLPDNFTKYRIQNGKVMENPDSERYERCGRTVTIPVIEAIGKKLGKEWYD